MVKIKFILVLFVLITNIRAQDDTPFVKKGLLKATATISPSFMLNYKINNIYVSGELEYFLENKISVRGDAMWYRDSQQDVSLLKQNSMLFFGGLYHCSMKKHDLYIGLQPAVILSQPCMLDTANRSYPLKINPGISVIAGYTLYVWDYCNFFINVRYINAKYLNTYKGSINLDEIVISAGLGFQLHTLRKK